MILRSIKCCRAVSNPSHIWDSNISVSCCKVPISKRFMGLNWDSRQTNSTNREIPYMRTILKHKAHFSLSELRNSSSFHGWIRIEWTRLKISGRLYACVLRNLYTDTIDRLCESESWKFLNLDKEIYIVEIKDHSTLSDISIPNRSQ